MRDGSSILKIASQTNDSYWASQLGLRFQVRAAECRSAETRIFLGE